MHESIRRLDAALAPLRSRIERPGEAERLTELAAAWRVEPTATDDPAVPLLAVALEFDELADVVTVWAHDIREPRPNNAVDQACARIEALLELLGVPRESMDPSEWRGRARQ